MASPIRGSSNVTTVMGKHKFTYCGRCFLLFTKPGRGGGWGRDSLVPAPGGWAPGPRVPRVGAGEPHSVGTKDTASEAEAGGKTASRGWTSADFRILLTQ